MVLFTKVPQVEICSSPIRECGFNAIVVGIVQKDSKPIMDEGILKSLEALGFTSSVLGEPFFTGKKGEIKEVPLTGRRVLYLVGLGEKIDGEVVRRGYAKAAKQLLDKKWAENVLVVASHLGDLAREALLGFLLGAYRLDAFRSEKRDRGVKKVLVDFSDGVEDAVVEAEGTYLARDVANAPPNELYPERLASLVRDLFSGLENVSVEVFDYEYLVKNGFGGIVNVGKGSAHKPALIIIKYNYRKGETKPISLVGKTLVFDAGGINLKPSHGMTDMRMDKAGGAAVLGATWIIAKKKLPVSLVTLLPAAINVPSGESYLPSDVIKMWDGTRVEVTNTDAEGRLVLADAIAYAAKELSAEKIIELSTLTGAIVIALGPVIAGLFTRNTELEEIVEKAARETGEKVWPMPMEGDYKPWLTKGAKLGDIDNAGSRWGGAIYAALFLEKFTHGKDFVHLDIAGPGIGSGAGPAAPDYWPSNLAPGYGARLVAKVVESLSKEAQ